MSDPNEGSVVLFKRGRRPDGSMFGPWEVGYVVSTFFVDESGAVIEPDLETPHEAWLTVRPAAPEGEQAPNTLTVPLASIDPVVHGTELPKVRP